MDGGIKEGQILDLGKCSERTGEAVYKGGVCGPYVSKLRKTGNEEHGND